MADIAAGDVSYSITRREVNGGKPFRNNYVTITVGDGAKLYQDSAGVPLTLAGLGMTAALLNVTILDDGGNYHVNWQSSDNTLRLKTFGAGTIANAGSAIDGALDAPTITLVDDGGAPTKALGHLAGALSEDDATPTTGITGVQAPGLGTLDVDETKLSVSASYSEIDGVAIAAQTIKVLAIGW